jgi:hypothetical protein
MHVLLIDDARLFCAPPPAPLSSEQWPTLPEVLDAIRAIDPTYDIVLIDDAIIATPPRAKSLVTAYCQERSCAAWECYAKSA